METSTRLRDLCPPSFLARTVLLMDSPGYDEPLTRATVARLQDVIVLGEELHGKLVGQAAPEARETWVWSAQDRDNADARAAGLRFLLRQALLYQAAEASTPATS